MTIGPGAGTGGVGGVPVAFEYDRDRYFHPIVFRWMDESIGQIPVVARVLEPPEGFEEWFFETHNITEYDCGGISDGDINVISKRHGFEIPESKQFKFNETLKPKMNQFAFPCQMQRHSDSFFLVHFSSLFEHRFSNPVGLFSAAISKGIGVTPDLKDEKFVDIRWPIGNQNTAVLKCRHYYVLEDVVQQFFWPGSYDPYTDEAIVGPAHPSPNANEPSTFYGQPAQEDGKFRSYVGVMRITDFRYDLNSKELGGTRQIYQEDYNDSHIKNKERNSIYSFAKHVDPNSTTKPTDEDRADAPEFQHISNYGLELTVCPNVAPKMTSGQLQDMQAYANGYIGLPRMFFDAHQFYGLRHGVTTNGLYRFQPANQRQFLLGLGDPSDSIPSLQRLPGQFGHDFIMEAMPAKNAYDPVDRFSASFMGYPRYRNLLSSTKSVEESALQQTRMLRGIDFQLDYRPERVRHFQNVKFKFKTLLGVVGFFDEGLNNFDLYFPSKSETLYNMDGSRNNVDWARYISTRFCFLNFYLRTTKSCNYRYHTRIQKGKQNSTAGSASLITAPGTGSPASVRDPWYRLIHKEIRAGRLPMPETLYLDFSGYSLYGILGITPSEGKEDDSNRQVFTTTSGNYSLSGDPNFTPASYSVPLTSFDSPQAIAAWESGDDSRNAGDIYNLSDQPQSMVAPGSDASDMPTGTSPPPPQPPTDPDDPQIDPPTQPPTDDPTIDPPLPPTDDPTVDPPSPPPPPPPSPSSDSTDIEHCWVRVHHIAYLEDALPLAVPFVLDSDYLPVAVDGDIYIDTAGLSATDRRLIGLIGFTYDNGFDAFGYTRGYDSTTRVPAFTSAGSVLGTKIPVNIRHLFFYRSYVDRSHFHRHFITYFRRGLGTHNLEVTNTQLGGDFGFAGWWFWGYNVGNCGCSKPP